MRHLASGTHWVERTHLSRADEAISETARPSRHTQRRGGSAARTMAQKRAPHHRIAMFHPAIPTRLSMIEQRPEAVLISGEGDLYAHRDLILAQKHRLPAMCPYRDYVEAGGLMV